MEFSQLLVVAFKTSGSPAGQSNYISIQSRSGITTVIVNQASAIQEPCSTSCDERQTLEAQDDISAMPAFQSVK